VAFSSSCLGRSTCRTIVYSKNTKEKERGKLKRDEKKNLVGN
jgi:hypothetical protein